MEEIFKNGNTEQFYKVIDNHQDTIQENIKMAIIYNRIEELYYMLAVYNIEEDFNEDEIFDPHEILCFIVDHGDISLFRKVNKILKYNLYKVAFHIGKYHKTLFLGEVLKWYRNDVLDGAKESGNSFKCLKEYKCNRNS